MKKVILLSEREVDEIKCDIIDEIIHFSSKNYGFKMVSRDTGEEITDRTEIIGMLSIPVNKAFDKAISCCDSMKGQKRYGHRVQCDACEGTGIERGD